MAEPKGGNEQDQARGFESDRLTGRFAIEGKRYPFRRTRPRRRLLLALLLSAVGLVLLVVVGNRLFAASSTVTYQPDAENELALAGTVSAAATATSEPAADAIPPVTSDDRLLGASLGTLSGELTKLSSLLTTWSSTGFGSSAATSTIIREIVHTGSAGGSGIDTSAFVPRSLFDAQVDATLRSIESLNDDLGTSLSTGALTTSGNAMIGQALTVSNGLTLSSFTAGSIPFVGSDGVLSEDIDGLVFDATNVRVGVGTSSPATVLHAKAENPVLTLGDSRSKTWSDGEQLAAIDFASDDGSSGGYTGKVRARVAAVEEIACCSTAFGASVGLAFSTSRITDGVIREYMRLSYAGDLILSRSRHTPFGSVNVGQTYLTIIGSGAGGTGNIQLSDASSDSSSGTSLGNIEWHNNGASSNTRSAYINVSLSGTTGETIGSYMAFATEANGASGDGTERMRIDSSGNVGIGTADPSSFKLQVAGNIGPDADDAYTLGASGSDWECVYYSGGSVGTCASDERLKQNIEDLTFDDPLAQIAGLRPRSFEFTNAPGNAYNGLIAQEVQEVAPELVTTGSNGYLAIKYGDIQWLIISALQSVIQKVEALADTVAGFADKFTTKELCVERSDGRPVCLTGDQLDALLAGRDAPAFVPASGESSGDAGSAEASPFSPPPSEVPSSTATSTLATTTEPAPEATGRGAGEGGAADAASDADADPDADPELHPADQASGSSPAEDQPAADGSATDNVLPIDAATAGQDPQQRVAGVKGGPSPDMI